MRKFTQTLVSFVKDESGPTAVEYAVMLALIIVVCITAVTALGTNAANTFSYVGSNTGKVGSGAATGPPDGLDRPARPDDRPRGAIARLPLSAADHHPAEVVL